MERQESKAKAYQSWRPSVVVKPTHGSLWKAGAEMDWTFPSDRKNKTRIILLGRHRRQGAGAFLECRQSLSFFHLANFVNHGALQSINMHLYMFLYFIN
jgi:hypothetical protein